MTRQDLKDQVDLVITTNGNEEITGAVLATLLKLMIDNMPVLGVDNGLRTYNPASVYQVGDTSVYSGQIFACNTADTTGAFNPANWDLLSSLYVVQDNAERDAIVFREEGMECFVLSTGEKYQLIGGTANVNWVLVNGTDVYRYEQTASNGQTVFVIPDREIIAFQINGTDEDASKYSLAGGDGTTQNLTWEATAEYTLDDDDLVTVIYKGTEVTI